MIGSAQEDGSQSADVMMSARSELISEDAADAVSQQSNAGTEQESKGRGVFSTDCISENGSNKCDSVAQEDRQIAVANTDAVAAVGHVESMISYDCSYIPDRDALVIDPEAANPMPDQVAKNRNRKAAEEIEPCSNNEVKQKVSRTPAEAPPTPNLDVLIGCWWDEKDSFYEVTFDEGTTSSCHVKTTRPGGAVRETAALIRVGQVRGKSAGRIIWGSAFVLEMPVECPDLLQWKSVRGGRDFSWIREVVDEEMLEYAKEADHVSASAALQPSSKSEDLEPELQQPMPDDCSFSSSRGKTSTRRRVWRPLSGKQQARGAATSEEVTKLPREVAAATCRRVKSHNGEWRVIEKGPRQ